MTHHDTPAISVRGLRRSYGKPAFEAVRGLDLEVAPGTVTALLGTNGAGKTSTMEVIEGLAAPTSGEVRVLGLDPVRDRAAVRHRTGVLLQSSGFSGDLTVEETLAMWRATLTNPRSIEEALGMLRLEGRAGNRVTSLSGGERRRLDLACTLMGHPDVVLLDEPTTGLDPESRRDVWQLVRSLRDGGATVLITTHYLDEAEALADWIEIMHAGVIVRSGTTESIVADHPSSVTYRTARPIELPETLGALATVDGPHTTLRTEDLQGTLTDLLGWAAQHDVRLEGLQARTASLESVFLEIAGHPSADGDQPDQHEQPDPAGRHEQTAGDAVHEGATR